VIGELSVRDARDEDLPAVLALLRQSMGRDDDERFDELFRWKHLENPFGRSPMWVACDGDRIVALRALMRWEFERAGETFRSVRMVDTATHPDYQGRGVFTKLTRAAIAAVEAEGVDFVFNTPNAKSLPGYLKMGWQEIGRAPARVRPFSALAALRLVRSRVPASHWSEPIDIGVPVEEVLAELMRAQTSHDRLRTRRTEEYLRWRYARQFLRYRAIVAESGIAIVRVRHRGDTRETVLADAPAERELLRIVCKAVAPVADHAVGVGTLPGWLRVPSLGPIVTTRDLARAAPRDLAAFDFSLGDIELF
jgi:GNAT superfamily N-acetyltransferase